MAGCDVQNVEMEGDRKRLGDQRESGSHGNHAPLGIEAGGDEATRRGAVDVGVYRILTATTSWLDDKASRRWVIRRKKLPLFEKGSDDGSSDRAACSSLQSRPSEYGHGESETTMTYMPIVEMRRGGEGKKGRGSASTRRNRQCRNSRTDH